MSLAVLQTIKIIKVRNGILAQATAAIRQTKKENWRNKGEKITQGRQEERRTVMTQTDKETEDELSKWQQHTQTRQGCKQACQRLSTTLRRWGHRFREKKEAVFNVLSYSMASPCISVMLPLSCTRLMTSTSSGAGQHCWRGFCCYAYHLSKNHWH